MRRAQRERASDNGFTLIELLVVVVIIGILIAIAIPLYLNYRKGAADRAAESDLRNAIATLETCNTDNSSYPTSITVNTANGACTGKQVNTSSGTTLGYYPSSTTTSPTSYLLIATTSSGSVTGANNGYYCYASAVGGSVVKKTAATTPNTYAASC